MKNVLITGGAGRVAEFIAAELADDYDVTLFDTVPLGDDRELIKDLNLPFVVGDLLSLGDCMRAITFAEADAIVHMGAVAGPRELVKPYRLQQRSGEDAAMVVNTMGTFYLLDAARRLGVKRFVAASTDWVLGHGGPISDKPFKVEYLPIDEEHPVRPENTYGLAKLLSEHEMETFARAYDMQTVALRFAWVDSSTAKDRPGGPGWRTEGESPEREPSQNGLAPGEAKPFQLYNYLDVRDAARICRLALEAKGLDPFEVFYVATDTFLAEETRTVSDRVYPALTEMAKDLTGHEGFVTVEKARKKLGFEPQSSWRKR
jgi:nucleoside-diphosphate-sugar epimerase